MQLYGIRRRNAWATAEELEAAAKRSSEEGDKPDSGVRWIRSYVLQEDDGTLGTYCIYEATSPTPSASTPRPRASRPTRSTRPPTP